MSVYGQGPYGAGYYSGAPRYWAAGVGMPAWDLAYTTDDASDTTSTWTTVAVENIRSVSVSRGREDELGRVEAGTATLVLNNRANLFNPVITTGLRPMNRWRLRAVYNAVTYDVFLGYAESYEQQWPATGEDAITVVRLVDEFKVLALDRLLAMDPPTAQSYAEVVQFDEPQGYWQFQDAVDLRVMAPTVGPVTFSTGTIGRTATPIVGDPAVENISGTLYGARSTTEKIRTIEDLDTGTNGLPVGGPGDAGGLSEFTVEMWFKSSEATPAAERVVANGPLSGGAFPQWGFRLQADGKLAAFAFNSGGTNYRSTASAAISANVWYHIVLRVGSGNTGLFINGVAQPSASYTGSVGTMDAGGYMQLGTDTAVGGTRYYDEVAFYRYAVPDARFLVHYTAGVSRGFAAQDPGARFTAVLNASTSVAASSVRAGSREMIPTFMTGQPPLDELRKAEAADNVDAFMYIAKDGTITFLDDGHRSASPWNAVQATFDDDGTDLPYKDVTVDYSETFLYNTINVTRTGGTTSTSTDSTSVSRYRHRHLSLTDLPITTDSDQSAIATALLAKYKDPMTRVTSITVELTTAALIAAGLDLELADRIRILRTPVGGGTRIDQTSFVQSIQLTASPDRPWQLRFGVSPL